MPAPVNPLMVIIPIRGNLFLASKVSPSRDNPEEWMLIPFTEHVLSHSRRAARSNQLKVEAGHMISFGISASVWCRLTYW